jgi:hypothetical protein
MELKIIMLGETSHKERETETERERGRECHTQNGRFFSHVWKLEFYLKVVEELTGREKELEVGSKRGRANKSKRKCGYSHGTMYASQICHSDVHSFVQIICININEENKDGRQTPSSFTPLLPRASQDPGIERRK